MAQIDIEKIRAEFASLKQTNEQGFWAGGGPGASLITMVEDLLAYIDYQKFLVKRGPTTLGKEISSHYYAHLDPNIDHSHGPYGGY